MTMSMSVTRLRVGPPQGTDLEVVALERTLRDEDERRRRSTAPRSVCQLPCAVPSATSPKLAPSMSPAASAFETATARWRHRPHEGERASAPSPVASVRDESVDADDDPWCHGLSQPPPAPPIRTTIPMATMVTSAIVVWPAFL